MPEFAPFDLGRVMQVSESIKAMRRDGENDKLRQAYIGEQIQNAQQTRSQQAQTFDTENQQRLARTHWLSAQAVVNSQDPVATARQLAPEMVTAFEQQHGAGTFERLPPEVVKQIAQMGMQESAAKAGINLQPDANTKYAADQRRAMDEQNFGQQKELAGLQHGYRMSEAAALNAQKPGRSFRALTPDEVAQAGLPAGTSAQIDETTGKIDVVSKRDNTNTLSQKDQTTARMKLNTVKLARQQLNAIKESFDSGTKGLNAFGPVQGMLPTEAGHAFDRRVDQMRSTLTALTRVPGVGAMSDYETKLDQAKFPTRGEYEKVTQQQIADLDNMLNAVETGYNDLLSGGGTAPGPDAPQTGGWSIKKVK